VSLCPQSKRRRRQKKQDKDSATIATTEKETASYTLGMVAPAQEKTLPPFRLALTDEVLGYGSAGTIVFAGQWEGRDVAVKRMLKQFWELAERETSLLITADEHENVIRYFAKVSKFI
jgi:hypothetical protein